MTTTETKTNEILNAINADITTHEEMAKEAMNTLEQTGTSPEEYKEACTAFSAHSFITCYLRHIRGVAECGNLKDTENIIRFHSYYQSAKGKLNDGQVISVAQATVCVLLGGYIKRFFDTES